MSTTIDATRYTFVYYYSDEEEDSSDELTVEELRELNFEGAFWSNHELGFKHGFNNHFPEVHEGCEACETGKICEDCRYSGACEKCGSCKAHELCCETRAEHCDISDYEEEDHVYNEGCLKGYRKGYQIGYELYIRSLTQKP
jgi:hypothetical protein